VYCKQVKISKNNSARGFMHTQSIVS